MSDAQVAELLSRGIAAARAGDTDKARKTLTRVTALDGHNEQAWLWLSSLADDPWDRHLCLEKVREINPGNGHALAGLRHIELQAILAEAGNPARADGPRAHPGLVVEPGVVPTPSRRVDRRKQVRLWATLSLLLVLLAGVVTLFARYLAGHAPLPDLLPASMNVSYPPHYLFSIYGAMKPVGVALSPEQDRIYVAESAGERMVRVFDRTGQAIGSFAPPRTDSGERTPVYLSTDSAGRVFVTDRLQHAILVYDRDGGYLDTILAPDLTLSEYVDKHVADFGSNMTFAYNRFEPDVYYGPAADMVQTLPAPGPAAWSPLGLRVDRGDRVLVTDILGSRHAVREIPAATIHAASWVNFDPSEELFGETWGGNGQLLFPNAAVSDSQGRIYVTDGNNGRIAVWNGDGSFVLNFGQGTGEGALGLPRGAAVDARDRLYIVDAVGQKVLVYDVSGAVPAYLFSFGGAGLSDGQFNYPNDVALDASGRLYIADRENDRIQVWSY